VILRPNYRGSGGYGERFRSAIVRRLGFAETPDIIAGVETLVHQGYVDPSRLGVAGYSYGGTLAAYIATTSDRFQAAVVEAGTTDWALYYGTSDNPPFPRQMLRATPWEDPEIYRRVSPISYVKQAKTPTLIQHGERDARVPVANARLLYRGLQDQG